jgi:sulfide:quinone oxidoreductase
VLIAGGGVAGLEAALALRDLAGERVSMTMLTPEPYFVYRPMAVVEPFALAGARRYDLAWIANNLGVTLRADSFAWLDPAAKIVHTGEGDALPYDALLLALGARRYERFRHALTLDDRRLDDQLHGLIEDIEGNYVHRLAFLIPPRMPWPLPVYELALMTATRAYEMGIELAVSIISPESGPLEVFGAVASDAVAAALRHRGVEFIHSPHCEVPEAGCVSLRPQAQEIRVDRIVALPELFGPAMPGVAGGARGGFIPVDAHSRVKRMTAIYAAGDATDFPIKLGGVAAHQADIAAEAIAAMAGAPVSPRLFDPRIEGILLGGEKPLRLSARLVGSRATSSKVEVVPMKATEAKIAARLLTPYLAGLGEVASFR